MTNDDEKSLPKITTKNWWAIRNKLKSTMPKALTKSFVSAALNLKEISANTNVISPMKQMGLLAEDGSLTDLANEWRTNETYKSACDKIKKNVYPQELQDLAPDLETDKNIVQNWIASRFMVGREAARQSAAVYMLLLEGDASKEKEIVTSSNNTKPANNTKKISVKSDQVKIKSESPSIKKAENSEYSPPSKFEPILNLNIQIHISADSSADQIDKIFSSMAKHLRTMNVD